MGFNLTYINNLYLIDVYILLEKKFSKYYYVPNFFHAPFSPIFLHLFFPYFLPTFFILLVLFLSLYLGLVIIFCFAEKIPDPLSAECVNACGRQRCRSRTKISETEGWCALGLMSNLLLFLRLTTLCHKLKIWRISWTQEERVLRMLSSHSEMEVTANATRRFRPPRESITRQKWR